jgi:hypothetical protein
MNPFSSQNIIFKGKPIQNPCSIRHSANEVCVARGGARGIIAKLWRVLRIEIPIGYQDETGFHRIVERSSINQQMKG